MIYEYIDENVPIRQGDIFENIPKVEIDFGNLSFLDDNDEFAKFNLADITKNKVLPAILPISFVPAIVISQDCDISRTGDVSLCQIVPFTEIDKGTKGMINPANG